MPRRLLLRPTYTTLGIDIDLFHADFAVSRIAGWAAHVIEQHDDNRLIRPRADYVGRPTVALHPHSPALAGADTGPACAAPTNQMLTGSGTPLHPWTAFTGWRGRCRSCAGTPPPGRTRLFGMATATGEDGGRGLHPRTLVNALAAVTWRTRLCARRQRSLPVPSDIVLCRPSLPIACTSTSGLMPPICPKYM